MIASCPMLSIGITLGTPLRRSRECSRLELRGSPRSSWGCRYTLLKTVHISIIYSQVYLSVRASFPDDSKFSSTTGATRSHLQLLFAIPAFSCSELFINLLLVLFRSPRKSCS